MKYMVGRLFESDYLFLRPHGVFVTNSGTVESINKLSEGDVVLIYCTKANRYDSRPLKSFVGLCRIKSDELFEVHIPDRNEVSFGKRVTYVGNHLVPLRTIAKDLEFMRRQIYAQLFLEGFFQVSFSDAAYIAKCFRWPPDFKIVNPVRKIPALSGGT